MLCAVTHDNRSFTGKLLSPGTVCHKAVHSTVVSRRPPSFLRLASLPSTISSFGDVLLVRL